MPTLLTQKPNPYDEIERRRPKILMRRRAVFPAPSPPVDSDPGYVAAPVNFNGTNTYLTLGSDLTGAEDSKQLAGSGWFRRIGGEGNNQRFLSGSGSVPVLPFFNTSNLFKLLIRNASSTIILDVGTESAVTGTAWHHAMWSFDLTDAEKAHLYLDGVSSLSVSTFTDDTLDLTRVSWAFGALPNGTQLFNGDMADFQLWFGTYVDLSQAANRQLFINGGRPVDPDVAAAELGDPIIRFSGDVDTWHTNKGTGEGFAENGELIAGTGPVQL